MSTTSTLYGGIAAAQASQAVPRPVGGSKVMDAQEADSGTAWNVEPAQPGRQAGVIPRLRAEIALYTLTL